MRVLELDRYQKLNGLHARETMESYLAEKYPLPPTLAGEAFHLLR